MFKIFIVNNPVTKNKVRTWLWFDVVRGKEALTGKA
jgi:hypothetical protein